MKTHHKSSKRVRLSTKYNLQKRVREHKRRMKKQCKKMGLHKKVRKDPGIPNSWPFKAEMLKELEEKKAKREEDMAKRHAKAKAQAKVNHQQIEIERREAHRARDAARREKRALEAEQWQLQVMRKTLPQAEVFLHVLDARDPLGCRCPSLEAWAQENKKRVIFVLAKADLIPPEASAKWLVFLGQTAPTVAVQAEAGREGIRELLALLGHTAAKAAPGSAPVPSLPAAAAVGVFGYAGTGKKALCKAIRQEVKAAAPWLLEACRLRPSPGHAPTASSALHAALCANAPRGAANATSVAAAVKSGSGAGATDGVEPVEVIKEFLARTPHHTLLRFFRLPTFEGAEGFLKAFAEDRKLKNKKGKPPLPAAVAQRILAELPALPGCFCLPPEASSQGAQSFWAAHGDARQGMQLPLQQQAAALSARGSSGPAAGALALASGAALGPAVDVQGVLEEGGELELDVGAEEGDGSDDDMGDEGEEEEFEGEEEEEAEGEESEEDMEDD